MITLEAINCGIRLGGRPVLEDVDFRIEGGEMIGILGPNGAGKSTLVKALAGLLPCCGIHLDGRSMSAIPPLERARMVAYLPQNAQAYWQVSCRDIVALGRMPHRGGGAADRRIVEEAMAEMDVMHLSERALTRLSGGERARVLLARALAVQAPVLLADEPIAHLDACHQLRVLELLRSRADKGEAVVVVLHDLSLAARMCDRVYVLNRGRVAASGCPDDILDDGLLASVFGITVLRGEQGGKPFLQPWKWVSS